MTPPRKLNVDWPPFDRLPVHIREGLRATHLHATGHGAPPTTEHVRALIDLTSWAFNGVGADHDDYDTRLAHWTALVCARHRRARMTSPRDS